MPEERILRRPKRDPDHDMAHVLRWGVAVGLVLFAILPPLFRWVL